MISIIMKKSGKKPRRITVENDFDVFQTLIDGYVECHQVRSNMCVLCDEDGNIFGRPYNVTINGVDYVGTILIVGYDGNDFCDAPVDAEQIWMN